MRLIDADKIRYTSDADTSEPNAIYKVTKDEIEALPTVDAVPIIRCGGDCKYSDWYLSGGTALCYCTMHGVSGLKAEDYCSKGEKE